MVDILSKAFSEEHFALRCLLSTLILVTFIYQGAVVFFGVRFFGFVCLLYLLFKQEQFQL